MELVDEEMANVANQVIARLPDEQNAAMSRMQSFGSAVALPTSLLLISTQNEMHK